MHIAFILAGLGAGGAERVVSLIASRWAERGWKITIIAFDAVDDAVYHHFNPRIDLVRLDLPPLPGRRLVGLAVNFQRLTALRRTLRALRPDIAIAFLTKINALTLLASVGLAIPVIVSERNNPRRQAASPLWNVLLARLYRRAAAVVMQTQASLMCLPPAIHERAIVIPNPILAPMIDRTNTPCPGITAVGRLTPQKGFDQLLNAFARVAAHNPEWTLTIWGEGPARPDLEAQVAALGLTGRVAMPGLSATPGAWVAHSSIFVLPSRFEGFPNVLGEAMASGLAAIAFDCAFGPREMMTDDVDGLLVADGDIGALAGALDRLMRDASLRDRIAGAARVNARRFAVEPILDRWDKVVRDCSHVRREDQRRSAAPEAPRGT